MSPRRTRWARAKPDSRQSENEAETCNPSPQHNRTTLFSEFSQRRAGLDPLRLGALAWGEQKGQATEPASANLCFKSNPIVVARRLKDGRIPRNCGRWHSGSTYCHRSAQQGCC